MKYFSVFCCIFFFSLSLFSQPLTSPQEFLGYELGEAFTRHHRVIEYFQTVAAQSPKVELIPYGTTYEGRPLMIAVLTSEERHEKMDQIKRSNLIKTGLQSGTIEEEQVPIVWLSYNIHGNESVSTEAAMKTLYALLTKEDVQWLEDMVIILDPCVNPDGRDRYVNWYNQVGHRMPNVHANSLEHREPWPGGRFNHYLFDLNRDWCWQTQIESQQRAKLYHQWMPHVHVDFHEMGPNSPYFFGPAAEPYHEVITRWQREFQQLVGKNHARYFDENGWLYFTRETYDLLYPSYGDTWPTYQGAIGFTYEQGGSGRAGLGLKLGSGDTLTLGERLAHHFTTGLSTIETAHRHRNTLLQEFNTYFDKAINDPPGPYRSYVIKADNPSSSIQHLMQLMDRNQIQYQRVSKKSKPYRGYEYATNKEISYSLQKGDILISSFQPQANLVKVLFEPQTSLEDSLTYDLTAWALPYAYNLKTFASKEKIVLSSNFSPNTFSPNLPQEKKPVAYLTPWEDVSDAAFLAALQLAKVKVRYSTVPIEINEEKLDRGTLLITRTDNPQQHFDKQLVHIANTHQQVLIPTQTGFADEGKDFGSSSVQLIAKPNIALVNGPGVTPASFGEMWHYFEQVLAYPVTVLHTSYLSEISLSSYNIVVLPSGSYDKFRSQLMSFVNQGGKVIALERSIGTFVKGSKDQSPKTLLGKALGDYQKRLAKEAAERKKKDDPSVLLKSYENRERARLSNFVAGSIYRISMDATHPLSFGIGATYYSLKRSSSVYPFLPSNGWNVGVIKESKPVSGFTGSKLRQKLTQSLSIGVERVGRGQLIYLTDSPIFRGFWHSGKLLLGNAIFLM
ncbi:MAG: M14 family metallopeptidase [Bacteroidota bacterium]